MIRGKPVLKTATVVLLFIFVETVALADDAPVVEFQKLLPSGREFTLLRTFLEKGMTRQPAEPPSMPGTQWSKPTKYEIYAYTVTVREKNGKTLKVWETKLLRYPEMEAAGDVVGTVEVFDVAEKKDQIAILCGEGNNVKIIVITPDKREQSLGYAVLFDLSFFGRDHFSKDQGATQRLKEGRLAWLDDLYAVFTMVPSYLELWRVRKDGVKKLYGESPLP